MTDVIRGRLFASLMLTLLACPAAWATEPVAAIDGPSAVKVDKSIVLSAAKSVSEKPLAWKLLSPPGVPLIVTDEAPRKAVTAFVLDPEAGEYIFSVVAKGKVGDEWEADVAIHRVVVGDPAPRPPPDPAPTPDPKPDPRPDPPPGPAPVPPGETLHATMVLELDQAGPLQAALRTSPAIRKAAESRGIAWRSYDDDQAAVRDAGLLPFAAKAGGFPALIVQAADGRVLLAIPCPLTADGVIQVFQGLRPVGGTR